MGIGKLYFLGAGILFSTLYMYSHYDLFDGSWHRPGAKSKVRRERKQRAAQEKAEKRAERVAEDLGFTQEEFKRQLKHEDRRTAPYFTKPDRPLREELRNRSRSESRPLYDRRDSAHSRSRGQRSRRTSGSSTSSSEWDGDPSSRPRRSALKGPVKRYRTDPFSEFVPEENFAQYTGPKPPSRAPIRAENGTRRKSDKREPKDFSIPDHHNPGHTVRNGNFEGYKHLYGGFDDQQHCLFPGAT